MNKFRKTTLKDPPMSRSSQKQTQNWIQTETFQQFSSLKQKVLTN